MPPLKKCCNFFFFSHIFLLDGPLKPGASSDIVWHSQVGIFTSTPEGRYTFAIPATAWLYGYPFPAGNIVESNPRAAKLLGIAKNGAGPAGQTPRFSLEIS
jgi:hypothetical protein